MSVSTTIDSALGVVSVLTTGTPSLAISENAVFTGAVDFTAATVTGVPSSNPNVLEIDDAPPPDAAYDMFGGVRVIRMTSVVTPWAANTLTITQLNNLGLAAGEATTVKLLTPISGADRTVVLTGMTLDGTASSATYASLKIKQKTGVGVNLEIVRSGASYFVFGSDISNG